MTSFSDTLTIGLVLLLLFGSVALYLYTCIQQSEQKISLLESILLDLKMSTEVKSYSELPMDSVTPASPISTVKGGDEETTYAPFDDDVEETEDDDLLKRVPVTGQDAIPADEVVEVEDYKLAIADAVEQSSNQTNYDSMTLKELQSLAKSRGITGVTKKGPLIEALKTSDRTSSVTPGPVSTVGSNSFLETSASVSDESV
jgi:hypothetical protein